MTGYTWTLGRVVAGVQLVDVRGPWQFDETDYPGHWFVGPPPTTPAMIDGVLADAGDDVRAVLAQEVVAADLAANGERYVLENVFFLLCNQHFGDMTKRGTKELLEKAFTIMETDQKAAMTAFGVMVGLDKELTRIAGARWWDTVAWHPDPPELVTAAQKYLGLIP
jgi:hypothetical protein